jgi:hypothetical protein
MTETLEDNKQQAAFMLDAGCWMLDNLTEAIK